MRLGRQGHTVVDSCGMWIVGVQSSEGGVSRATASGTPVADGDAPRRDTAWRLPGATASILLAPLLSVADSADHATKVLFLPRTGSTFGYAVFR